MLFLSSAKISQWNWYDVEKTTSTNDEVRNIINETGESMFAVSAKSQSGGRGRRGRKWQGIEGNLYFSYSMEILPEELSRMVCLIGLSLAKSIQSLAPSKKIQIKWPNDVFLEGGKISGILLENMRDNLWIIGIGVNVVSAPKLENTSYYATSLKECTIMIDRLDFLRYYLQNFAADISRYKKEGFAALREEWLHLALNYKKEITVKTENSEKSGIFLTLDDNGYLILKTKSGKEERIIAGDLFV